MAVLIDASRETVAAVYGFQPDPDLLTLSIKLLGEDRFVNEHTYSIMSKQGRMGSFDIFMQGKFGKFV